MARKLPPIDPNPSWAVHSISDMGKLVRNQRAVSSLRIDHAAALCGVSSNVLSRLENGKPVTLDKLLLILNGLGLRLLTLPTRHALDLAPTLAALATDPDTPA